jgi:hypothetical protein
VNGSRCEVADAATFKGEIRPKIAGQRVARDRRRHIGTIFRNEKTVRSFSVKCTATFKTHSSFVKTRARTVQDLAQLANIHFAKAPENCISGIAGNT